MTTTEIRPAQQRHEATALRPVAWCAGIVGGVAVLYALTMLTPYVVNDLHRVPLAELTSGLHDPGDLWPQGWVGGLVGLGALLAMAFLPLVAFPGAVWSIARTLSAARSRAWPVAAAAAATAVMCAGLAAFTLSPLATALMSWQFD